VQHRSGKLQPIGPALITMKSQIKGLKVSSALFGLICVVHIVRLLTGFTITIGSIHVGILLSILAMIVTGSLSVWLWTLACPRADNDATAHPASG
jgi:ABC-type uncharacterized transport system permease subunit